MKVLLPAVLAALALTPAIAEAQPAPIRAPCHVSVQFGSYAMGIDGRAFERVQRYTDHHPGLISGALVTRWGREGERTVCITTRSPRATRMVFADMRKVIGRGQRGPVEVRTEDGRVWRTQPRPGA